MESQDRLWVLDSYHGPEEYAKKPIYVLLFGAHFWGKFCDNLTSEIIYIISIKKILKYVFYWTINIIPKHKSTISAVTNYKIIVIVIS